MPFRKDEGIRRTLGSARLKLFAKRNLFGAQTFFPMNSGPTWGSVAATQEFLIDAFVARAAIAGSQMCADREAMMVDFLLAWSRLVAVEAVDALFRMGGHFVFVHYGVLETCMALCTLSRSPDKVGGRLCSFDARALSIDEKCRHDQRKSYNHCQENRAKRHASDLRAREYKPRLSLPYLIHLTSIRTLAGITPDRHSLRVNSYCPGCLATPKFESRGVI